MEQIIMKFFVKVICASLAALSMTACAGNQAAQDYYIAMSSAAQANAQQQSAKFEALARMAETGDPATKSAAVMALALTSTPTIAPQYVESSALKWAQVLTPAVSTLGLGAIQAVTSMNASDNAKDVQMASFATNEAIQLGQQQMVSTLGTSWAGAAASAGGGAIEVALAGFDALNTAGDQTVTLGMGGLDTADSIANAGLGTANSIALGGFTQLGLTAEDGINATANVGLAGMTNLVNLGTTSLETAETLGIQGMLGIHETNEDWLTYQTGSDTTTANLITTSQTNFTTIIDGLNTTIDQLGADLADPITCSPNADGLFVCQ